MSKKVTEFDRYERMKKLQKEAEAQKKKQVGGASSDQMKKGGKSKTPFLASTRNWSKDYDDEDYLYDEV